jgi:NAD(P)-dependent dehydrogenase (short-subunit alcohol dehydrogenase family)
MLSNHLPRRSNSPFLTYAITKLAVLRRMESLLAAEWASQINVNLTSVYLGCQAALERMRRIGQPADVAAMILFLARDESQYVTGAEFAVDGGITAQ